MKIIKKMGFIALIISYIAAGTNHFIHPDFYIKIIPAYLPWPAVLNCLAGFCEIGLGLLLAPPATRQFAAWGIILMLVAFLPVHINMVVNSPPYSANTKLTLVLVWVRLLLVQPLLILWAWLFTKKLKNA
jgi:uncharacterized membrane protein